MAISSPCEYPKSTANAKLKARILAGEVSQATAIRLERGALAILRQYADCAVPLEDVKSFLDGLCAPVRRDLDVENRRKSRLRENHYRDTAIGPTMGKMSVQYLLRKSGTNVIIFLWR